MRTEPEDSPQKGLPVRLPSFALFLPTLAVGLLTLAPASYGGTAYHGTVVDSGTVAPLQGAVVVVVWHRKPIVTMDGPQYFHRAVEVLTDADGKFSVDASPGIDWNPFTHVLKEPRITIFKPGFGPFPVAHVSPPRFVERFGQKYRVGLNELNEELLRGAVVALPKLKTGDELRKFTDPAHMLISTLVPPENIPNLMRLIDVQRQSLGLQPYPRSLQGGRKP